MPESSAQDIPKQEYVVSVFNLLQGMYVIWNQSSKFGDFTRRFAAHECIKHPKLGFLYPLVN